MATDKKPAKTAKSTGRPLGPTGEAVRSNIKRIRERQRIAVTELSNAMRRLGRPIPPLGIHRIEDGQRRVDVDDLVAFSVALNVSPSSLLMPDVSSVRDTVAVTGNPDPISAGRAWAWIGGSVPISEEAPMAEFSITAWPLWYWRQFESAVEEALTERQRTINGDDDHYMTIEYGRRQMPPEEDTDGDD